MARYRRAGAPTRGQRAPWVSPSCSARSTRGRAPAKLRAAGLPGWSTVGHCRRPGPTRAAARPAWRTAGACTAGRG
eukprot:12760608-Alexandrium_andersonii.AAC.1